MANDKGMNPVVAGVVGAAVGAAATVAAIELTDPKKRDAIGKGFEKLKDKGEEVVTELKETVTSNTDKS